MLTVNIAGYQAHSNTGNRSLNWHAGRHQRQRRCAYGTHRCGTVRTNSFRHLTNSIWELFAAWKNWNQSTLSQSTVTNFATLRRTYTTSFTCGVWRHLIVVHVCLGGWTRQSIYLLFHLQHVERSYTQNLGFTTLEQSRTVNARNNVYLCRQGSNIAQTTTIDTVIFGEDTTANNLALQFLECVADLLVFLCLIHVLEFRSESILYHLLNLRNAILTWQLFCDRQSFVQICVSNLVDASVEFVCVLWEELELLGILSSQSLQLVLSFAQNLNEWLSSFQTACYNSLIWLGLAFCINEVPCVLASTCFNHSDSNIAIFNNATSNNQLKYSAFTLRPAWESNPLTINQSQTQTRYWTAKWQTRDHSRCRCSIHGNHVICIIWVDRQNGFHNLHFVTKSVWEEWAQWAVDNTSGQSCFCRWTTFATEEGARNLTCCIHLLFNIYS